MSHEINHSRRILLGASALGFAMAQFGVASTAAAQTASPQGAAPGTAGAPKRDFAPLKRIDAGDLSIAYAEVGPADGPAVLLLHGWPYDIYCYVDAAHILAAAGYRVLVPFLRGYGTTRFLSDKTPRNAQPAALAADAIAFLDALKIEKALVGGCDWGARTANILAAIWPERVKGLVSVSGYLLLGQEASKNPLPPKAELLWWYQFYFATDRGLAGYTKNTKEFARLIWELASPRWAFDDATFERSARALENPDHVAISIHNYRWRLSLAAGEARYGDIERKIAALPDIGVPTITLEGDANGAPHPDPKSYARKYTGRYEHRNLIGGIGHNLPQEAPEAFAKAIIDVDKA